MQRGQRQALSRCAQWKGKRQCAETETQEVPHKNQKRCVVDFFNCEGDWAGTGYQSPREVVEPLHPWRQSKAIYIPGQWVLGGPAEDLDHMIYRNLFQPQEFCNSVFSLNFKVFSWKNKVLMLTLSMYKESRLPRPMHSSVYFHYSFCCNSWCDKTELINFPIVPFLFLISQSFSLEKHDLSDLSFFKRYLRKEK